jgi:hypothetical protein
VHPRRIALLVPTLVLLLGACGGGARPASTPGGMAPADAVERFMRAAEQKQYNAMGWLFGTPRGSVMERDKQPEVEQRMYAIASILEHERFAVRDQSPVPGSATGEMGLTVAVTNHGRTIDVPFTTVKDGAGRWFVEKIQLEAVTAAPSTP